MSQVKTIKFKDISLQWKWAVHVHRLTNTQMLCICSSAQICWPYCPRSETNRKVDEFSRFVDSGQWTGTLMVGQVWSCDNWWNPWTLQCWRWWNRMRERGPRCVIWLKICLMRIWHFLCPSTECNCSVYGQRRRKPIHFELPFSTEQFLPCSVDTNDLTWSLCEVYAINCSWLGRYGSHHRPSNNSQRLQHTFTPTQKSWKLKNDFTYKGNEHQNWSKYTVVLT